jgi:hypothetical protein
VLSSPVDDIDDEIDDDDDTTVAIMDIDGGR